MIILFSLLGIVLLSSNLFLSVRRSRYLTIVNIISVITIIDLYIPAIIGNISGRYFSLPYVSPLKDSEVLSAVILADFAYLLLLVAYNFFNPKILRSSFYIKTHVNPQRIKLLFLFSVVVYFLDLYFTYKSFGSWLDFYTFKLTRAYAVTVEAQSNFARVVSILSETTYVIMLMMFSMMLSHRREFSKNYFRLSIIFIVLVCLLSLSRGTILGFFISVVAVFEFDVYRNGGLTCKVRKIIFKFAIIGVCAFLLFGGLRNTLQQSHFSGDKTSVMKSAIEAANNTFGNSLIALTRTVRYVESGKRLFGGQSYGEMFLSLVPRSIMPNKPKLYGVQTLTMAEGSPESTMDAITMPGELIINFGYFGILFMILWGAMFRLIDNFRYKKRMKYYLASAIFTISTTCSWMSFTGFFAQTKYILIYYIVLKFVTSAKKKYIIN